jgi:uncharacterized membrane protein YhfC
MVNILSLAFIVISLLIIFLFLAGIVIFFYKKEKFSLKAMLIGALVFVVFQFPLSAYLSTQEWFKTISETNLLFYAVIISGVAAAFFDELGRFIGFRYLPKSELLWKNGIAFGIGHGGTEAIVLIIGLTYANIAPHMLLVSGIERVLTIIIHIALSLTVLYGIVINKSIYLLFAIMLHTVLNSMAVIIMESGWGIWYQVYILVFAAICLLGIFKSRRYFESRVL